MNARTRISANGRLRHERELRGWSQKRVADALGTNKSMISRWEGGVMTPSPHFREQLCQLFGKTAEELGFLASGTCSEATIEGPRFWHVPLRRNPFFTGREANLEQIQTALQAHRPAGLSLAISGLGGIGKTSLVLEYAYRFRAHYQAILWVGADSREHLLANLAWLTRVLDLPEQHEADQGRAVAAVQRWLQNSPSWLLIVDNVEDLGMAEEVLPSGPGHLLITTRAHATSFAACRLNLAPLSLEEGTLLLLRRARLLPFDALLSQAPSDAYGWAAAIAKHLDGLPLALDQAGAYVEETGCSLEGYFRRLTTHQGALLQRRGQMIAGHPESVTATLLLSIARMRTASPEAAELLECCAFLHPDAIPRELFTQGASELGPGLAAAGADALMLDAMLEALGHFSLLLRDPQTQMLRLHRLVQAVLTEQLTLEQQQIWADRIVRALHRTLPEVGLTPWADFSPYFSQALRGCELITAWNLQTLEAGHLLTTTGAYLHERAQYLEAERLLKRSLALQRHHLGRKHPETARTLYHLANLYQDRSFYWRAQRLYAGALAIQEQTLGPEHPQVAYTLTAFADLLVSQGDMVQAKSLAQRALSLLEQHVEPTHPSIADCLRVLGHICLNLGHIEQALVCQQRALTLAELTCGPISLHVAASLNGLANIYHRQQDYERAEAYYQRALSIGEQTLPCGHPDLPSLLQNLAALYTRQGQYMKALPLAQRACELSEQTLGPEHPTVAFGFDLMARIALGLGDVTEAERFGQRALDLRHRLLGSTHPFTATSMRTLAHILQHQERVSEAESLFQQALALHEQVLGPDHLTVAEDLEQYAQFLRQIHRGNEAIALEVRAQAIRSKYLPADQLEGKQNGSVRTESAEDS